MKTSVIIGERGQVTVPKPLRDRLGIRPGMYVTFRAEAGRLIVEKVQPSDPLDEVYGKLADGRRSDRVLAELRGA